MKKTNNTLMKFTIVAAMIGVFSPSVSVTTDVPSKHTSAYNGLLSNLSVSLFHTAEARRGGGASRSRSSNRSRNTNRNKNVNRNKNTNRNVNVNRNKNTNVNVNVNRHGGGYYGRYPRGHYGYYRGAPLMVFTTGLIIGSVIAASTMPTTCTTVVTGGVTYRRCGSSYYQPFYEGDTMVYKVVTSPY